MPFIGNIEQQRENANGKLFREFLTDAKLVAVNTHFGCGPTYYGEKSNSRVDYVCYSSSTFTRDVKKCSVWQQPGDRLQPIQTFHKLVMKRGSAEELLKKKLQNRQVRLESTIQSIYPVLERPQTGCVHHRLLLLISSHAQDLGEGPAGQR